MCVRRKSLKRYAIISFLLFWLFSLLYFFCVPKIYLEADDIHINVWDEFDVSSIKYNSYNFFTSYKNRTQIDDNINISKIGKYKIVYSLKFGIIKIKRIIYVFVEDAENPSIVLEGDSEVSVCPGSDYDEVGYSAYDNYDKDITKKVIVKKSDDKYTYSVSDSSGNSFEIERIINKKDIEAPKITLNGLEHVTIYLGDSYNDDGAVSSDNCDGDLSSKIIVDGSVDVGNVGEYKITYKVSDSAGNTSEAIRYVNVVSKKSVVRSDGGVIYLTFDDGPSDVTVRVLDTLSKYNVKATFFVTGSVDGNPSLLSREAREGHAIALHTYSHNYASVYSSVGAFWDEIDRLNNSINNIVGFKSNILRFPGGVSNTVSRHYTPGIMTELSRDAINRGYHYFDWNVDSDDAGGAINNSNKIYSNVINNLNPHGANVVLMHDSGSHSQTANALGSIIEYGLNNGYSFKVITMDTEMVRHRPNN